VRGASRRGQTRWNRLINQGWSSSAALTRLQSILIGDYVGHSSAYMTDRYRDLIKGQAEG
jgi:hypothetical protein